VGIMQRMGLSEPSSLLLAGCKEMKGE